MQEFHVKIRDHRKLKRRYLYLIILTLILLFIGMPILFQFFEPGAVDFLVLIVVTFIYFIVSFIAVHNSVKTDKPISISENEIVSKHYGSLLIKEIAAVEIPLNYNGHHSLLILTMKTGQVFSVNVLNKYNGMANDEFEHFVQTFKKVLRMNKLEIKG